MTADNKTVKTFYPKTPVEFSSTLLSELDNSNETNYTRQQYAQQYIEKEVHRKLAELESNQRTKLDKNLEKSLLDSGKEDALSVKAVNEKLDKVHTKLAALNQFKPTRSDELAKAEGKVAYCLGRHQSKPLNCWQQVADFKKVVSSL